MTPTIQLQLITIRHDELRAQAALDRLAARPAPARPHPAPRVVRRVARLLRGSAPAGA